MTQKIDDLRHLSAGMRGWYSDPETTNQGIDKVDARLYANVVIM